MEELGDQEMSENQTRLEDEMSLLSAMYPEQIHWDERRREVKFTTPIKQSPEQDVSAGVKGVATLVLRLPDNYLLDSNASDALPIIISAEGESKQDLRRSVTCRWQSLDLRPGEEVLDQILVDFQEALEYSHTQENESHVSGNARTQQSRSDDISTPHYKTVIIWLHHLLATGKRKLALSPTKASPRMDSAKEEISGLTKPGYPGIMMFTGPIDMVDAHVAELKTQRWQAFQVRFEESHDRDHVWQFVHGTGIQEVETMSAMVAEIQEATNREGFLKAVGVK